ncbi:MAG: protein-L-isoaspartate O-methyltransferase family protein [Hyphomicrobiales bacterium]
MFDYDTARANMVESQVRPNSVTDRGVIDAMAEVPREAFLPRAVQTIAYMDEDVVVAPATQDGLARYVIQPMVFARLVQLAEIQPGDLVLDVGCGLGYSSAVLARMADAVVALECDEGLAQTAADVLVEQGVDNAAVVTGVLNEGYASEAPYDAIVLNGSVSKVPEALLGQLKEGGRLVAVVGEGPLGRAHLYIRHGEVVAEKVAFDATVAALPGFAETEPSFAF